MLRISQPKIQWQSWPPSADILPCRHIVLSCFAMTAFVANTPTFAGHPSNLALLGRTDESASDWTLHNSPKSQLASKTCSVGYPQHHYQQMSREGARAVVHRFQGFAQNRCQARCAPNRAPRGIFALRRFSASPSNKRQHEPGWRAKPACRHFHYPFATISITPL